jgi:hypothetical protein
MNTVTLGQLRSTLSRVEGVCSNNAKVAALANEADARLLNRADTPVGSIVESRWCIGASNCIVFPRQVRTVEAYSICNSPGSVRPPWFAYIGYPNGPGYVTKNSGLCNTLIDKGTTCAFDDVVATVSAPRRIAAIASNVADVGKKITLRYFDSTGQRVYTSIGGIVQEGEQLTLVDPAAGPFPSNAAVVSNNVATRGLYFVVKEVTQYPIYLYEYDPTPVVGPSSITKQLASYDPSEETPIYRRALIPGLTDWSACDSDNTDCTINKSLTALVKLQHVPVVVDNDPLVIGNVAALKLMVMAIMREEQNRLEESAVLEQKARAELDGELSSYLGDGVRTALRVEPDFGAGYAWSNYAWTW